MSLALIINPQPTRLTFEQALETGQIKILQGDQFIPDATTSRTHTVSNQLPSDPIEIGSKVSSHVINDPDVVTISGRVSNTPLDQSFEPGDRRAEKAYDILYAASKAGAEFTIITPLREYTSMVMLTLVVPEGVETANVLDFTATFQHVQKVGSVSVAAPLVLKDKGTRSSPAADEKTTKAAKDKSLFAQGADFVESIF